MSTADECTPAVSVAQKLAALQSPDCYPVPGASVSLIETHFAWVFMVGDHAYKMKKPIASALLDVRSVVDRKRNCMEEVRLNRRLAPDVYLGVVPLVVTKEGAVRVGAEGTPIDWLVWMKRLPAASMLDRATTEATWTPAALTKVGELLAHFYARQCRYFYPARYYLRQLLDRTEVESAALLAPELKLDVVSVKAAVAAVSASLSSLETELGERAAQGCVRECHGDLRPEHICLEPPCVIDSLEFSRQLRILDPAEELAYLHLECEVAGASEVAEQIIAAYQQCSGDRFSRNLLYCYQGCRALVRAKILAWHILDPTVAALAPWTQKAQTYIALAERHGLPARDRQS